jgi:hypothetical protein
MRARRAMWVLGAAAIAMLAAFALIRVKRSRSTPSMGATIAPGGYARGALLRYLPEACGSYRVYVDVKSLTGALALRDVLTSGRMPPPLQPIFRTFEEAHLRLGQEIEDLAVCAQPAPGQEEDDPSRTYVAIGGRFGGRDALHKYRSIVQGLTHARDSEVLEKESNGIPYLVSSYTPMRKWIAMPGPDVLVFYTDAIAEVAALAKTHDVDAGAWQLGEATLASFEVRRDDGEGASSAGTLAIDGPPGSQTMVFDARVTADSPEAMAPARLALLRGRLADAIEGSAFSELAEPVRQAALEARGESLHVRFGLPVQKLIDAGMTATTRREAVADLWGNLRRAVMRR